MIEPTDKELAQALERLPAHIREAWEERAAIRQYDGELTRASAERLALMDVRAIFRDEETLYLRSKTLHSIPPILGSGRWGPTPSICREPLKS